MAAVSCSAQWRKTEGENSCILIPSSHKVLVFIGLYSKVDVACKKNCVLNYSYTYCMMCSLSLIILTI